MEDSTDGAPSLGSFDHMIMWTQLYLGEKFVFEYTGHLSMHRYVYIRRKGVLRGGGKQANKHGGILMFFFFFGVQ